jgi:hypothetical protein
MSDEIEKMNESYKSMRENINGLLVRHGNMKGMLIKDNEKQFKNFHTSSH